MEEGRWRRGRGIGRREDEEEGKEEEEEEEEGKEGEGEEGRSMRKERRGRGEGGGKMRRRQSCHLYSPAGGLPGVHGNQHRHENTPNKAHLHPQHTARAVGRTG